MALGWHLVEIDCEPFSQAAALLYGGPWVAERYAAVGDFLAAHEGEVDPIVGRLIVAGRDTGAVEAPAGGGIEVEIWELGVEAFGRLVATVPPPLSIGTVTLEDGRTVKGFLCEASAVADAPDITSHGGWRSYRGSRPPPGRPADAPAGASGWVFSGGLEREARGKSAGRSRPRASRRAQVAERRDVGHGVAEPVRARLRQRAAGAPSLVWKGREHRGPLGSRVRTRAAVDAVGLCSRNESCLGLRS